MTPKEARLIIKDGGLRSLVECSHPDQAPEDDCVSYLVRVHAALKSLEKLVRKTAKENHGKET